ILNRDEVWQRRDERTPRRAAVSAFGFGGINAHLLMEEWSDVLLPSPPKRGEGSKRPPAPASAWPLTSARGNRCAPFSIVSSVVTTRCHPHRRPTGGVCQIASGSASKVSIPTPSPATTSTHR